MIIPRHVLGRGFVAPSDRLLMPALVLVVKTIGHCYVS
jgi:hypothetical protein